MILLDTNIFIIDRFFKNDQNYKINKKFMSFCVNLDACVSIFSLFELCGIASFNLSTNELKKWLYHFDDVYKVNILEPRVKPRVFFEDWFKAFSQGIIDRIGKKMTFGDSILLKEAEDMMFFI